VGIFVGTPVEGFLMDMLVQISLAEACGLDGDF
jgi:hypothetical protein